MKPPSYFDLEPFKESFNKFCQIGPDVRAKFRKEVQTKLKELKLKFCNEIGESIKERSVDIIEFGSKL